MPRTAQHHALARQWQVLRLLPTKPPGITTRELVDKLEREGFSVTKRTVERDLAELSTLFGIACNDKGMPYGWHWMKGEYADLPGLSVSDAVSLRLVEDLLRPLLPSAILESLEARFDQAKAKLAELSANNPNARWAEKVRYVPPALQLVPPKVDPSVLDGVHEALLNGQQIDVDYPKPPPEDKQRLRLNPLGLIQRGQITYLAATAYRYDDIRLYPLHRILAVQQSEMHAAIPEGFSLDSYIESGAMEFGSGEKIDLKAWVSPELGSVLHETPLNSTQILEPIADGFALSVEVVDSWQLNWWLLSQGSAIRVIEPTPLKNNIMTSLAAALKAYEDIVDRAVH